MQKRKEPFGISLERFLKDDLIYEKGGIKAWQEK